ncbi:MAG TPA: hypothetical protein VEK79_07300 [Thermoanaerobaculia bacterium]|nr:hypothetical protein [Thermoanaerobaculia bacterium]
MTVYGVSKICSSTSAVMVSPAWRGSIEPGALSTPMRSDFTADAAALCKAGSGMLLIATPPSEPVRAD